MTRKEFEKDYEQRYGVPVMREYETYVKEEIEKTKKVLEENLYPSIELYFRGKMDILKQLEECIDFLGKD